MLYLLCYCLVDIHYANMFNNESLNALRQTASTAATAAAVLPDACPLLQLAAASPAAVGLSVTPLFA